MGVRRGYLQDCLWQINTNNEKELNNRKERTVSAIFSNNYNFLNRQTYKIVWLFITGLEQETTPGHLPRTSQVSLEFVYASRLKVNLS